MFQGRYGAVVSSRRIATGTGFRGRAAVYLIRLKRHYTCLLRTIRSDGGGGAGCSPSGEFLSASLPVEASTGGRFLSGAVANQIARVAFVDHGRLHSLRLTRDGGFLYSCRGRNGCVGISAINGYNRHGSLVFHEGL